MARQAVVLGGSVAGLLAARALADTYDKVIVVDRDELNEEVGSEPRKAVPQGRHAHVLLFGGLAAVEELLPGVGADLMALGAEQGDMLGDVRFCFNGGRLAQRDIGLLGSAQSRPLLESYLRSRVRALPQVEIRDRTDVVGLVRKGTGADLTVVGARVQRAGEGVTTLSADLVVDATGRGSRTPVWLDEWGFARPEEEKLKIDLTYTTQYYRLDRAAGLGGNLAINVLPDPSSPRGGVVIMREDGAATLTLFGYAGVSAPTDHEGFRAYARSLHVPDLDDAVAGAEPVLPTALTYRYPSALRRHYERLKRFPAGLLVIGDALCSFTPAYGQGMSVSAQEALLLHDMLGSDGHVDAPAFFRRAARIVESPWRIAVGGDLSLPQVSGPRPLPVRFFNAYVRRLTLAAQTDSRLAEAFLRVSNLAEAPERLLRPDRALRVLRGRRAA